MSEAGIAGNGPSHTQVFSNKESSPIFTNLLKRYNFFSLRLNSQAHIIKFPRDIIKEFLNQHMASFNLYQRPIIRKNELSHIFASVIIFTIIAKQFYINPQQEVLICIVCHCIIPYSQIRINFLSHQCEQPLPDEMLCTLSTENGIFVYFENII